MAKQKIFNYVAAAVIVFLLILWYYQNRQPGPRLFPGEHVDTNYSVPVITAARDTKCSTVTSGTSEGIVKKFTVLKDTAYFLTIGYFTEDTLRASCRASAAIFLGDSAVVTGITGCPGGHVVLVAPLKPGINYTLLVNLLGCPDAEACKCGANAKADASVSMRRLN